MAEVLRPRNFGELLGQALSISFRNFGKLFLIQIIFLIPMYLLMALSYLALMPALEQMSRPGAGMGGDLALGFAGLFGVILLAWLLYPVLMAASFLAIADGFTGRTTPITACYAAALRRILPLFLLSATVGLVVLGGCCFFVVGFFYFMARYYVAVPAMVLERVGVGDALNRSWALTQDQVWPVLGFATLIGVIGAAISGAIQFPFLIAISLMTKSETLRQVAGLGPGLVGATVQGILASVGSVVLYFDLRTRKEALDLEGLVALVDQIGPSQPAEGAGL